MKILLISSYLPYPLYSGGQIRLYNLIQQLGKTHEITLICEKRQYQTIEEIAQIEKICKKVITVSRKKQWSVSNVVKSAVTMRSFLVNGHTNSQLRFEIESELMKDTYDLIHVETFYIYQNLPKTNLPVVLVEHNIEYLVYKRYMQQASILIRPLLFYDIAKIKLEEIKFWEKADRLVTVSEEDKKVAAENGVNSYVVPNGVNPKQFELKNIQQAIKKSEKKILFIGDFKWIQNTDSAEWIIKEIWPKILKEMANPELIKLWILGRQIPDSIKKISADKNILLDEENSSLPTQEIFKQAYILLAPIRVGGGTSYKILESMSVGTPVVTTALSGNAINATDGRDIMIGSDAHDLARKTNSLINDQALYSNVALNARSLIEKNYTWEEIAKKLEDVYFSIKK